jgi:hypothetical protein
MSPSSNGRGRWSPTRSTDIGPLQDAFLISAVTMIIVIRFQLWVTNYPQLGSGNLHIAHLLWGGLWMLVALFMLFSFVGHRLRLPAAILGGIGFGFFIDELGKFITSDNDYFFEPAAAIIYLIFIVLYLVTRWMQGNREMGSRESLVNAADMLSDAADRGFDDREKRQALELLSRADKSEPLTAQLTELVRSIRTVGARQPGRIARLGAGIRDRYARLVEHRLFDRLVIGLFVFWAIVSVLTIFSLGLAAALTLGGVEGLDINGPGEDHISFINAAAMASSLISSVLVISGVVRMRRGDRLGAYYQFDRSLMVELLLGGFFSFVEIQFSAVAGLLATLLLLITVRLMIEGELELREAVQRPGTGAEAEPMPASLAPS